MKTKSITKITVLSIVVMSVITAVTLNSCQKESLKPKVANSSVKAKGVSSMASKADLLVADANTLFFGKTNSQKGLIPGGTDSNSCVIITRDTIDKPHTVSYNYGGSCIGSDGNVRSGVAVVSYSTWDMTLVNNVISVSFQNYSINGTYYNGSVAMTNTGPNSNNNIVLTQTGNFYSQSPGEISADTANIYYSYEWIAGEGSSPLANLQFSITGGATYSYTAGQADSVIITSPLIKNAKTTSCNYMISGTEYMVHYTVLGPQYQYIDFGNPGGCSGLESLTQNGVTTTVSQQ